VVRRPITIPGRSFEGKKKSGGELGTPHHLARFPLPGGAGNCFENNTGSCRLLCHSTHKRFIYERLSQTHTVRPPRPHYATASSKRLMVGINSEESGLTRYAFAPASIPASMSDA